LKGFAQTSFLKASPDAFCGAWALWQPENRWFRDLPGDEKKTDRNNEELTKKVDLHAAGTIETLHKSSTPDAKPQLANWIGEHRSAQSAAIP